MPLNTLLIGNLTIDNNYIKNTRFNVPGGGVYFTAKTLENLNAGTTIVSPYGADFPQKYLPKTAFIAAKPPFGKTLLFKNIYKNGARVQTVENYEEYLHYKWLENFKYITNNYDLVIIAPVINNIGMGELIKIREFLPSSFFCLLPQGLYRQIGKTGKITQIDREFTNGTIRNFDFISFSEQDFSHADEKARQWSKEGPMVAVTRNGKGASIYSRANRVDSPAFKVSKIVDPTGAGDVFAAGFTYAYLKNRQIEKALDFGQAAAALSLRETSNRIQYNTREILDFAAACGRPINL